ncbi:hypothetical protein CONLIGDRAFT_190595 [Coniochaeta ligniaria NRRL 30616]|uniref:COP9 signalosome complex subunit 1 n=1 Tax=Coniochaeta ligniaria NRRL 30616 TaxID=1408157 RepID=A0A1J7K0V6_9PEZI|nr:hypothetical protein CONLIGDRAFT_190595 [Coniochaeta ligniaria NRRL 30616]
MADTLDAYFKLMEDQGGVIVKDTPRLDIDLYIHNYRGRTRWERLFLIGRTSTRLCVDALKAAVAEAKNGKDINRYTEAVEQLSMACPTDRDAVLDTDWMERTEQANRAETQRLEAELRGYKNNLIKESIRMGHEDLGKHYETIGDLSRAFDAYSHMRPDVSTPRHIVEVGKHLASVSLQRRDWVMVATNLNKLVGYQNGEDDKAFQPYQKIATGIALLGQGKYTEAAQSFLEVDNTVPSTTYHDIASANDVAIYGCLLALATMDRKDLQTKVLENNNFRAFLQLEPHLRKAVSQFVIGRYSVCLAILESYRPDYLLDLYLQRHVAKIYAQIREKCIVSYMVPFSCVTLDSMNAAFAAPGQSVEPELAGMIRAGKLQARINKIDELVTTVPVKPRLKVQKSALETARNYEKEAVERIRRMSLAAADLEAKGPRRQPAGGGQSQTLQGQMSDLAYEDLPSA